jgi:membrane-bound ClpP family serine protease
MLGVVEGLDWPGLALALGLMAVAAGLLLLEFFIVSFGLLLALALVCVGFSIYYGFAVGTATGWSLVALVPVLGWCLTRWGLTQVQQSKLVTHAEITAEAGYHHALDKINVAAGARGEMVTSARPTGRARFAGGECDVQVRSGALDRGAPVQVRNIDGPVVYVDAISDIDVGMDSDGTLS